MDRGRKHVRISAFLLALMVGLLAYAGCTGRGNEDSRAVKGSSTEKTAKYVVGFSNGFSDNSWRTEMLASLRREAERYTDLELIIMDGQGDINKQVADLETLIARRVDAIMLIPNSALAVTPVLKRAMVLGIKVLHFNLPLDDPDSYTIYVGPDERERGRRWARWLVERLGGRGNIVVLGGIPGNPGTAAALDGAMGVLAGTDIKVLAYRDAYWQEERGRSVMTELIVRHLRIDGILSDGGQVTAGALKALLEAGRPLVPVTGDDYNGIFKLYLQYSAAHPRFDFAVIATPTWQSKTVLQTALKLLRGETVEKWVKIEPVLITGRDAAGYAKPALPDSVFVDTDLPYDVLREIFR
jgi:ribose transport system substrate-binding protein